MGMIDLKFVQYKKLADYVAAEVVEGGPYDPETLRGRISTSIMELLVNVYESAEQRDRNPVDIIEKILLQSGRDIDEDAIEAARKFADGPTKILDLNDWKRR